MDITIESGIVQFTSSVMGEVNAPLDIESTEAIDDIWFHLAAGGTVTMVSSIQCTINGNQFNDALEAIEYLNSL